MSFIFQSQKSKMKTYYTRRDNIKKSCILVVSFGTTYMDALKRDIQQVEEYIAQSFPKYDVKRAFTSEIVRKILLEREGLSIHNVSSALEEITKNEYEEVFIQPLHIINGYEFEKIQKIVTKVKHRNVFKKLILGKPLLTDISDYFQVAQILKKEIQKEEATTVVLVGHGTEHFSNASYSMLEKVCLEEEKERVLVGTVEGYPELEHVIEKIKMMNSSKVLLAPLMLVAGDHAQNDIFGEKDSWKTALEEAGYQVEDRKVGIGTLEGIRQLYTEHIQEMLQK